MAMALGRKTGGRPNKAAIALSLVPLVQYVICSLLQYLTKRLVQAVNEFDYLCVRWLKVVRHAAKFPHHKRRGCYDPALTRCDVALTNGRRWGRLDFDSITDEAWERLDQLADERSGPRDLSCAHLTEEEIEG
jgi:hypothetical protein